MITPQANEAMRLVDTYLNAVISEYLNTDRTDQVAAKHALEDHLHKMDSWRIAMDRAYVCAEGGVVWHEESPVNTLRSIIEFDVSTALDPLVSCQAQELIDRGRAEAKKEEDASLLSMDFSSIEDRILIVGSGMDEAIRKALIDGSVGYFYDIKITRDLTPNPSACIEDPRPRGAQWKRERKGRYRK